MALKVGRTVYTGSTAAGPALEGQSLESGMLALPGAICDTEIVSENHLKTWVLDDAMQVRSGDSIQLLSGKRLSQGFFPSSGITGTGVIALLDQGMRSGLIQLPQINTPDKTIRLPGGARFTENDLRQVGRAVGAFRAGHTSLCKKAGIHLDDIETAYLCGASGTYVDAIKAQRIGLIPKGVGKIHQVGNTSLSMARDLLSKPDILEKMEELAHRVKPNHCMFAESDIFRKAYINELSYWNEGMPESLYFEFMKRYNLPYSRKSDGHPQIIQLAKSESRNPAEEKLRVVDFGSMKARAVFQGCTGCRDCIKKCPENALVIHGAERGHTIDLDFFLCRGYSCRTCEKSCPENVLIYKDLVSCH
jgi:methylamine methyltransferase corrinoid protein reductive activase